MNDIRVKQNSKKLLTLQHSARFCYNKAELLNMLTWITCILCAVICSLQIEFLKDYTRLISAISAFIIVVFQLFIQRYINIAASTRQLIDYTLFGFSLPTCFGNYSEEDLFEFAYHIEAKNPQKASEQYNNTGTDAIRGVKDWYTNINSNASRKSAIIACQKQNSGWDKRLTNLNIIIFYAFGAIFFLIIVFTHLNSPLINAFNFLLFFSSVIVKLIWEIVRISRYKNLSISIKTLFDTLPTEPTEKNIIDIQSRIDQRRKLPFVSSNILHNFLAKRYHKVISGNTLDEDI